MYAEGTRRSAGRTGGERKANALMGCGEAILPEDCEARPASRLYGWSLVNETLTASNVD